MDDFSVQSLQESRNEWCNTLLQKLTPLVCEGIRSIFTEAITLCKENNENEKYLMTFQNFLTRIPKWNSNIIQEETNRILEKSQCNYLTDLISCVHIIQLKSLTCMRVGSKQKKVDIDIPSLPDFVHNVYINCARKLYSNVYLFELNLTPLVTQKHNREIEQLVKECILDTVRSNIPIENILQVYLDESMEEDVQVEVKEEIISNEPIIEEDRREDEKERENNQEKTVEVSGFENEKMKIALQEEIESLKAPENIRFDLKEEEKNEKKDTSDIPLQVEDNKEEERAPAAPSPPNVYEEEDEEDDEEEEDSLRPIKIGEKVNLSDLDVHSLNPQPKKLNTYDIMSDIGLEELT